MHNFGKIQNEIADHLRSFHLSEQHAFLLSGLLLSDVVMPVYHAELARSRADIATAVAAERARLLDLFSKRMGISVATLLEHLPELSEETQNI